MNAAVVIATKGRADTVSRLVSRLNAQTAQPERIVLVSSTRNDIGDALDQHDRAVAVLGGSGLTSQRNMGLAALAGDESIVVFFDDDFIPSDQWLARAFSIFEKHPDVVGLTGAVLADGITSRGIEFHTGAAIVAAADRERSQEFDAGTCHLLERTPYGCNMAFRLSAVRGLCFDETLVLYGWQEDLDFGARVRSRGRVVYTDQLWGVHLGVKRGRVSGVRLGYSQIVNPWYLVRKGTMGATNATQLIFRNVCMNLLRSIWPESHVDRRGRLKGNLLAFADLLRRRAHPERAADL